jgi:hypothetical protein
VSSAAEAIINAAQKQHQQEAASSSSGGAKKQRAGSPSEPWAPALPAALAAWAALQVHIPANSQEGVQKGKQLLLDACLQVRAQQQPSSGADSAAAAAAGRKKKGAGAATAAPTKEVDSPAGGLPLLQPAVVNAVLLAMLQRGAGDPSAAREAAAAAVVVLEQLLGCSIPNAAAGNPLTPAAPGCLPDVHTWALTVRLWGAAQPFSTSTVPSLSPAALLAAAFSRKLPVAGGSSSWDAAAVQELAAAGVAALRAAGRHEEGLQLLRVLGEGGVVELSSGLLALEVVQLLEAPVRIARVACHVTLYSVQPPQCFFCPDAACFDSVPVCMRTHVMLNCTRGYANSCVAESKRARMHCVCDMLPQSLNLQLSLDPDHHVCCTCAGEHCGP